MSILCNIFGHSTSKGELKRSHFTVYTHLRELTCGRCGESLGIAPEYHDALAEPELFAPRLTNDQWRMARLANFDPENLSPQQLVLVDLWVAFEQANPYGDKTKTLDHIVREMTRTFAKGATI